MTSKGEARSTVDKLADQMWRLHNLYFIIDKAGKKIPFKPNWAQQQLLEEITLRHLIPKSRQFGMSTLMGLIQLDTAIFDPGFSGLTVAHDLEAAEKLFYRNIKLPYDNLPEAIKNMVGCHRDRSRELRFTNESMISVATSGRSGSHQIVHVSEFGKICAKYPERAREIVTGTFEAAGKEQMIIVESTAEGRHGYFYEYCMEAKRNHDQNARLGQLDWRYTFLPWWQHPDYKINPSGVRVPKHLKKYFEMLAAKHDIKLSPAQKAWYVAKEKVLQEDIKREYPCIAGDVDIFIPEGIVRMDQAKPDMGRVQAFMDSGTQKCLEITTTLGYRVVCTHNHRILTPEGFVKAKNLKTKDEIKIGKWCESEAEPQTVEFSELPLSQLRIEITEDLAEFLGFFVGDGSYSTNTLSVVCDAKDQDTIARVEYLIEKFFKKPGKRKIGEAVEVRLGCAKAKKYLRAIGVVETRVSGSIGRRVCVPESIKKSPDSTIRAFLKGLFEADGFAQRDGTGVKIHTKYEHFAREIQLLLLRFGITSRLSQHNKKSAVGNEYKGFELTLRTAESIKFSEEIGFVSKRKNDRALSRKEVAKGYENRRLPIADRDKIALIVPTGMRKVYDIQTDDRKFSAGGVIVHNSYFEEAFEQSIKGAYYEEQMTRMRQDGRICSVPHQPGVRVDTWWDLGVDDATAVVFVQEVGRELHFIDYVEETGEGLPFFASMLDEKAKKHGYVYGEFIAPHDINVREFGSGTTRLSTAHALGINFQAAPKTEIADGIETVRNELGRTWIDEDKCAGLITCLDSYQKEWDDHHGCFKNKPLHNWASHGADAVRNGVTGRRFFTKPPAQTIRRAGKWAV